MWQSTGLQSCIFHTHLQNVLTCTCMHALCLSIVLPKHIPGLLRALQPVKHWDVHKISEALRVPQEKFEHDHYQKALNQYRLLRVIEVFGETTSFEQRTWKKIHKVVKNVGRIDIANNIEETHKDLNELCKLLCFNL